MKAFLWHECPKVSDNFHPEGSVLIEAETLERAREIAVVPNQRWNHEVKKMEQAEPFAMIGPEEEPSAVFDSSATEEKVWVFPNAGCC